jgi:rhamnose utilization protein RhaD (predicted bifunctional aldolase and dehydrogenase)
MSPQRGWVAVRLDAVRSLFATPELRMLPAAKREQRVLGLLSDAIIEPADARPSVETPLHALLDTVIMHSHPVAANALGCMPDGEVVLGDICQGVSARPPLWLPYIHPGSTLAFAVADRIEQYAAEHGGPPDVVLQPNHGLFVAAPTAYACAIKHQQIVENA